MALVSIIPPRSKQAQNPQVRARAPWRSIRLMLEHAAWEAYENYWSLFGIAEVQEEGSEVDLSWEIPAE